MTSIAVVGVGAIGGLVGGRLAIGGMDVTLVCTSWRANASYINEHGLTIARPEGIEDTVRVRAVLLDEPAGLPEEIDILFVATKANDTERCLRPLVPRLVTDGVVVSLQNGMPEDLIIPLVGPERVIACVSYTGGSLMRPGYVRTHGGRFVLGELDGRITPRAQEIARILALVAPTDVSTDIVRQRWDKLAQVTMTVPVGAVTGVGFPAILSVHEAHPLLARLMCETLAVASAAGHPLDEVAGLTAGEWRRLAAGPAPKLSDVLSKPFVGRPGEPRPDPDEAPFLKDLKAGLPLELDHTNGYVIRRGVELGVPTPTHHLVVEMLKEIEAGMIGPGLQHLEALLRQTGDPA